MNFLADMGVSMTTVLALRRLGHDVSHLREQGLMRMKDPDIVAKGRTEGRIIRTFDLDFDEILALSGNGSPSGILVRMRNQTPIAVTPRLIRVIEAQRVRRAPPFESGTRSRRTPFCACSSRECPDQLAGGAFVTIEDSGYR